MRQCDSGMSPVETHHRPPCVASRRSYDAPDLMPLIPAVALRHVSELFTAIPEGTKRTVCGTVLSRRKSTSPLLSKLLGLLLVTLWRGLVRSGAAAMILRNREAADD